MFVLQKISILFHLMAGCKQILFYSVMFINLKAKQLHVATHLLFKFLFIPFFLSLFCSFCCNIILMACPPLACFYSQWSSSVWGGWGTGDANWALHPGPPAGADWSGRLHQLQLLPDAVSAWHQLRCHAGLWQGSERHLCEYICSDYAYLWCVRPAVFIYAFQSGQQLMPTSDF